MLLVELFYCVFWVSMISVIWFYTDTVLYYSQLLNVCENTRLKFTKYIKDNPDKYFPDFLYKQSLYTNNNVLKFLLKLASCPFCSSFWLSLVASLLVQNLLLLAPIYILTMFIVLGIKKMI